MKPKSMFIVALVVLGLAVFLFGKEAFSYLSGARRYARDTVKKRIPPELEISRLEAMLDRLDCVIGERRKALVDMQIRAAQLEEELSQRRERIEADKVVLSKAVALLENRQDSYVIGGVTYSHAEVDADARIKAQRFRQDKVLLVARQRTLELLSVAVTDAKKTVSDAEVERQQLANSVQLLTVRLESLTTASQVATDRAHDNGQSLGNAYRRIQQGIADLAHRLDTNERLLAMRKTGTAGIDYPDGSTRQSGLEALREVLQ